MVLSPGSSASCWVTVYAGPRPGGFADDRGRDAVDAPLDAADALAAVLDAGRDGHEIGSRTGCPRAGDVIVDDRRRAAVEHLLQVDDLGRLLHLAVGIAASASRTRSGLNSD